MRTIILMLLISSFLVGCQQSPRKQYYVLSATPVTNQTAEITNTVGLGPIRVAEYLQHLQLVVNRDNNSLQLTENAYWGEPLQKGITRVLAINLMNNQSNRLVETFPWRSDAIPEFSLRLTVRDMQLIEGKAVINASWQLINNETRSVVTQQHFVRNKPTGSSPSQIAAAYSELLAELADDMNKALVSRLNKQ